MQNAKQPKQTKEPPKSYADVLALSGVALVAIGAAMAWRPACYVWLGCCCFFAAYCRAKISAAAKLESPPNDRPAD